MSSVTALCTKTVISAPIRPYICSKGFLPSLRGYATGATRRQVTVANDNGSVAWSDLSTREKAARTTQQTFNFGMVIVGIVMTGGVGYLLYDTVFSTDSKVSHFNRAVDEIKASARCRELLGPSNKIRAYGEDTWNKWTRNRAIASTITKDRSGRDNMIMHFNVEGPLGKGVAYVHMVRQENEPHFEYKIFKLDVPGNATIFLRNTTLPKDKSKGFRFLGAQWK